MHNSKEDPGQATAHETRQADRQANAWRFYPSNRNLRGEVTTGTNARVTMNHC